MEAIVFDISTGIPSLLWPDPISGGDLNVIMGKANVWTSHSLTGHGKRTLWALPVKYGKILPRQAKTKTFSF